MRARQLEVFRTVMRCGTLTEAARSLHVTQPALSQILLHTEDELGFKLFKRIKGRLVPTPEAEHLFPEADRIFNDLEKLRTLAAELRHGRGGLVRLAASAPPSLAIVPAALEAFRKRNPEIRVLSSVVPVDQIVAMLDGGQAGLGMAITDRSFPGIETDVVAQCELVCLMPAGHALVGRPVLTPEDLRQERLISYRGDSQPGMLLAEALAGMGEALDIDTEIEISILALPFVEQNLGVAIVDGLLPWRQFPGVAAVPFRPQVRLPVSLLTSRKRPLSRHEELLEQDLRHAVADLLGQRVKPPPEA